MTLKRSGFTLIEVIVALGLSSLALTALISLTSSAARQQAQGMKSLSAEMNASLAFKAIENELSAATLLLSPAAAGLSSAVLEGCSNASGPGGPAPIDPNQPMRFFAFCQAAGTLYQHSLPGCPAAYACGSSPLFSYGATKSPVSASFLRPSPHALIVEASLTARSKDASVSRSSSFLIIAAAGRNQ